jgi:hypothetical protein
MAKHEAIETVKAFLRHGSNYPWHAVSRDGETLCPQCVRENFRLIAHATKYDAFDRSWAIIGAENFYEGAAECCANCNALQESAYGDPEAV